MSSTKSSSSSHGDTLPASGGQPLVLALVGAILSGIILSDIRIIIVGLVIVLLLLWRVMPTGMHNVSPSVYAQLQADFVAGNRSRRCGTVQLPNGATFFRFYSSNPQTAADDAASAAAVHRPTPSDRQLVVCLHGFSTSSFCWDPVANALEAAGYEVLAYDGYGRGLSGSDDSNITPKLLVSQLAHLLVQLFGDTTPQPARANGGMPELASIARFQRKPIIVMGWSMGGVVSANFALAYPSIVQRLVLVAPAGFPVVKPPTTLILRVPILRNLMVLLGPKLMLKGIDAEWTSVKPPGDRSMHQTLRRHFITSVRSNGGYMRTLVKILHHFPLEAQELEYRLIGQHNRPVLILWGNDDPVVPYHHAKTLHGMLPQSKLVTIHDGGHAIHMQRADEVNRAILAFLQQSSD